MADKLQKKAKIENSSHPAWQNVFVRTAALAFVCFCLGMIVNLQFKSYDLVEEIAELEAQVKEYEDDVEELSDQLARPYDDEYIKNVAREKLGLRMPDEIIFYNELIK